MEEEQENTEEEQIEQPEEEEQQQDDDILPSGIQFSLDVDAELEKIQQDELTAEALLQSIQKTLDIKNWRFPHPLLLDQDYYENVDQCLQLIEQKKNNHDHKFTAEYCLSLLYQIINLSSSKISSELNDVYRKVIQSSSEYTNIIDYMKNKFDEVNTMLEETQNRLKEIEKAYEGLQQQVEVDNSTILTPQQIIAFNKLKTAEMHKEIGEVIQALSKHVNVKTKDQYLKINEDIKKLCMDIIEAKKKEMEENDKKAWNLTKNTEMTEE